MPKIPIDGFQLYYESEGDGESPAPEVKLGDLEALRGVVKFPVRIKCATLAWNTLQNAFADSDQPATSEN